MPNASECAATKSQTFSCNGVGAASCSLQPCVKTYKGVVTGGSLTEHLVSTWTDLGGGQTAINAVNVGCLNAMDRRSMAEAGYVIEPSVKRLAYNTSIGAYGEGWQNGYSDWDDPVVKGIISEKCLYEMGQITWTSISIWSEAFFQGNMTLLEDQPQGPSIVEAFYDNILLYQLVAAMTGAMSSLSLTRTECRQDDGQSKTHIHVEVVRRIKAKLCHDLIFGKGSHIFCAPTS